jgi:hypothetical protein
VTKQPVPSRSTHHVQPHQQQRALAAHPHPVERRSAQRRQLTAASEPPSCLTVLARLSRDNFAVNHGLPSADSYTVTPAGPSAWPVACRRYAFAAEGKVVTASTG